MKYLLSMPLIVFLCLELSTVNGATFSNYGIKFEYPDTWNVCDLSNFEWSNYISLHVYDEVECNHYSSESVLVIWYNIPKYCLNTTSYELEIKTAKEIQKEGIQGTKDSPFGKTQIIKEYQEYDIGNYTGYGYEYISSLLNNSYSLSAFLDNQNPAYRGHMIEFWYKDDPINVPKTIKQLFTIFESFEFTNQTSPPVIRENVSSDDICDTK